MYIVGQISVVGKTVQISNLLKFKNENDAVTYGFDCVIKLGESKSYAVKIREMLKGGSYTVIGVEGCLYTVFVRKVLE